MKILYSRTRDISENLAANQHREVKRHDLKGKFVSMAGIEYDRDEAISVVEGEESKLGLKLKNQCVDRHVDLNSLGKLHRDMKRNKTIGMGHFAMNYHQY